MMLFNLLDVVILLSCILLFVLCGYGVSKDLNKIHKYQSFNWVNMLVVLFWPFFIVVRAATCLYEDLFK